MDIVQPTLAEARAGLRALKTILTSDGSLNPAEEAMLAASQTHILRTDIDVSALSPIAPSDLARAVVRPEIRRQLADAMVLHSFTSGEAGPEQLAEIEAFTDALGVSPKVLDNLRQYTRQSLALLRFDILRHMYIGEGLRALWQNDGFIGILRALGTFKGVRSDPAVAARYHALADLQEGTLGRGFYHHCRDNGFAFPGEPYGAPEMIVRHDMVHVLGGYGVDPGGELEVAAFTAGFRRQQSMSILLFVLCQFDLGVTIAPVAASTVGSLDPDRFLAALRRGSQMNTDLFDGWDPWSVIDQPLSVLRARYGILPRG